MPVNIAKLVQSALKANAKTIGLRSATLVRTTPGARTPGSLTSGTNATTTTYACNAMIEVLTVVDMPATLVQVNDRKIGVTGASLPAGIVPMVGDRITMLDVDGVSKTLRLVAAVSGDGVGALYEFQARV